MSHMILAQSSVMTKLILQTCACVNAEGSAKMKAFLEQLAEPCLSWPLCFLVLQQNFF